MNTDTKRAVGHLRKNCICLCIKTANLNDLDSELLLLYLFCLFQGEMIVHLLSERATNVVWILRTYRKVQVGKDQEKAQ